MNMEKWGKDLPIKQEVLSKLPCEPFGFNKELKEVTTVFTQDMDNREVSAVICIWVEKGFMPGVRKAYFSLETGEYLGDSFFS